MAVDQVEDWEAEDGEDGQLGGVESAHCFVVGVCWIGIRWFVCSRRCLIEEMLDRRDA